MTHKEYAESLRLIADWFEHHDEIKLPHDAGTFDYYSANTRDDAATLVRSMGNATKELSGSDLIAICRQFGAIKFRAVFNRDQVCERRLVGTRKVERIVPVETKTVLVEEELYEWDCGPIISVERAALPERTEALDARQLGE